MIDGNIEKSGFPKGKTGRIRVEKQSPRKSTLEKTNNNGTRYKNE